MLADVYVDWYSDRYGQEPYTPPTARQAMMLARRAGVLTQVRLGRSVERGAETSEGWVRVSAKFDVEEDGGEELVDEVVAPVWAAHSGDPDATLALHIDVALADSGFRRIGGHPLRDGWEG